MNGTPRSRSGQRQRPQQPGKTPDPLAKRARGRCLFGKRLRKAAAGFGKRLPYLSGAVSIWGYLSG